MKKNGMESNSIVKGNFKIHNIEAKIKTTPLMTVEIIENMRNLLIICGKEPNQINFNRNSHSLYKDFRIPSGKSKHIKCLSTDFDIINLLKRMNTYQNNDNNFFVKFQMIFKEKESLNAEAKELILPFNLTQRQKLITPEHESHLTRLYKT